MKNNKNFGLLVLCVAFGAFLVGCSNPDGEGLSDQEKLDQGKKARQQQMGGQSGGAAPTSRDALPMGNEPK